jgi:hypothetical protein
MLVETDSALFGITQARSCQQLKTPLRGSGDTFAIALKGSFNNPCPSDGFRSTHGGCGTKHRYGQLMMTMIGLTIAENRA